LKREKKVLVGNAHPVFLKLWNNGILEPTPMEEWSDEILMIP